MSTMDEDDSSNDDGVDISIGIIQYFGLSKESCDCGYCKSKRNPGNTYGLWAEGLPPICYQRLIDRNWRRCGKYVYKPVNQEICCPMYTIRCDATNFRLSKSQKKCIKRFNNYIKFDIKRNNSSKMHPISMDSELKTLNKIPGEKSIKQVLKKEQLNLNKNNESMDVEMSNCNQNSLNEHANTQKPLETIKSSTGQNRNESSIKSNKKKFLRRQKLIGKIMKRESCSEDEAKKILFEKSLAKQPKTKTLEEFLEEIDKIEEGGTSYKHTFKTKIIKVESKINNASDQSDYDVFKKYQMTIHNESENEISYRSYKRFLLDSPLYYTVMEKNCLSKLKNQCDLPQHYGAYHQHYYIDDRLVAVGVIDILPNCISSVYLFYDPEYNFLNLGIYSALREIMMVRKFNRMLSNLKYYYMGYYIHSCPKMRYKSKYLPSDLLCSETYLWFPIEYCLNKLNQNKYSRFCDDEKVIDEDGSTVTDRDIKVFYNNKGFTYLNFKRYVRFSQQQQSKINEYARLVGRKCSSLLFYYIDSIDDDVD